MSQAAYLSVRNEDKQAVIPIARKALPAARLPFEDPRVIVAAAGVSLANNLLRKMLLA